MDRIKTGRRSALRGRHKADDETHERMQTHRHEKELKMRQTAGELSSARHSKKRRCKKRVKRELLGQDKIYGH